jgi:hypothetical protein
MTLNTHPHKATKKSGHKIVGVDPIPLSPKTIKRIEEAKEDLRKGNVCTLKELKAELGLE